MPKIDQIKGWMLFLGLPLSLVTIVVVLCLALWLYPRFKLIVSDLLKVLGKSSQWIRRKSLETELEGTINLFIKEFNSELSLKLLPECNVEWVTGNTPATVISSGKAIVRISFGDDHDVNFYNAASSFIKKSLLPRTKPFLPKVASCAIDLLMIKNMLANSRRRALSIFNDNFRDEQDAIKDRFYKCEETEHRGLFSRLLLQEYHYLGEKLGDKTPAQLHQDEAERFWEWFYDLATRESEEMSELSFHSEHINVGVILVASSATYENFGKEPYLRRAYQYAARECDCIYLIQTS